MMLSSPENPEDENLPTVDVVEAARKRVATMAKDPDEEYEVLCALGLF